MRIIEIYDLPKISLNKWYSGSHWTKRTALKNDYLFLLNPIRNIVYPVSVDYVFEFKNRPLDASNCSAMLKIIEDILFSGNDGYKQITKISIESKKAKRDKVTIKIKQITET